jgi:hypothetical protein
MKNIHAQFLGHLNKGVPKTLTPEQRAAAAERFRKVAEAYNANLAAGLVTRRGRGKGKVKP